MMVRAFIAGMAVLASLAFAGPNTASAQEELIGDAEAGKRVFRLCQTCHAVEEGQNRLGPTLYNVIGRTAGGIEGFNYSPAHANSGIVWTAETLDPYLENPRTYIPGNRMAFVGIRNPKQRADVIAYLYSVSPDAPAPGEEDAGDEDAEEATEEPAEEDDGEE